MNLISDFEHRKRVCTLVPKNATVMALVVKFVNNSACTLTINNENEFFAYGDLFYMSIFERAIEQSLLEKTENKK